MRYQVALPIPITVTRHAGQPMHEQIADQVAAAVDDGRLGHGCRLPSTRTLAAALDVSRGVTSAAYELLFSRGYLDSRRGSGAYVLAAARQQPTSVVPHRRSGPPVDLRPGQASTEAFPLTAWRSAWRQASLRRPPTRALPPCGLPELRQAVTSHLRLTHGDSLAGKEVVITGGAAHGLRMITAALGLDGSQLGIGEPVAPELRRAFGGGPARPAYLPVDADGARFDAVPAGCRAILVSPDGHLPLGRIMSADRRRQAAAWAAGTGGHLIESACDTVVRPAGPALPRLSALAGDTSSLVGGFCELLTPTLKLGYAVVPTELAAVLGERIRLGAEQPPYMTQLAVAALLSDGTVLRLMHRLGRLYARKRALVDAALAPLRHLRRGGRDAVNTEVLFLPASLDAEPTAGELLRHGVRVSTLRAYQGHGPAASPALVLGYGHQPDAALARAMSTVATVLARRCPPAMSRAG